MILNGSSLISGSVFLNPKACNSKSHYSASASIPPLPSGIRSSWRPCQELKSHSSLKLHSSKGSPLLHLYAAPAPLFTMPKLPRRQQPFLRAPRASKDVPYSFRYPAMTEKPRWWWRTLSCLPYLMPLHWTSMCAETTYHLHPFLEDFEFLTYPFVRVTERLPRWFSMAYCLVVFLSVVKRKEWPHFFRFHVVMGMLLEVALQVIWYVNSWMPLSVYWGKIGMHFHTAMAFAYLFTVLECMRCALAGMYADVPFVCDAAYIHIPHN